MYKERTLEWLLDMIISSTGSLWVRECDLQESVERYKVSLNTISEKLKIGQIKRIKYDNVVYYSFAKYDKWENEAAFDIIRILLNYSSNTVSDKLIDSILAKAKEKTGISLHEQQREAVIAGVNNGFLVITGGPGTGKTCTLTTLTYVLRTLTPGIDIRFTAPTGKAARRITESTHNPSKTVQKELGITPENHHRKQFGGDVLIVDEVSMLDMETTKQVVESIQNGQKVIMVGDIDQLPSVGPGAVLRDLIFSEVIPVVQLTKTFRQANDSNLFDNIMRIKDGDCQLHEADDFKVVNVNNNPTEQLIDLVMNEVQKWGVDNIACLLPYRKSGDLCSNKLNTLLQERINPISFQKPYMRVYKDDGREVFFIVNDPVMQLENRRECANGDVGKIINVANGKIFVKYIDNSVVSYNASSARRELELAYSMSINKSQGSEYKTVIMAITQAHKRMLKRNLLYTGVTRATEQVVLLQEESAMIEAINTEEAYLRTTFFAEKLRFFYQRAMIQIA